MTGINLIEADLTSANLRGADLSEALRQDTKSTEANLKRVILIGADLTSADLTRARLDGALWDESTTWPLGFSPPGHPHFALEDSHATDEGDIVIDLRDAKHRRSSVRSTRLSEPGSGHIAASFEGVETYIERVLADDRQQVNPFVEEQLLSHRRMISDWHHTAERHPVVYERLMAALARLEAELFAGNPQPEGPQHEADAVHAGVLEVLEAVGRIGDEDEAADREVIESEVLPALENAADAYGQLGRALAEDAVASADGEAVDDHAEDPAVGEWIDHRLDRTGTWVERLERAHNQMVRVWKLLPAAGRAGVYVSAAHLAGADATLSWVITVMKHVWAG